MAETRDSTPLQLLIVEDDHPTQIFVHALLKKTQEFSLHTADNGQEAIAAFTAQRIDIIITDLQMDGMDGHKLLSYMAEYHPLVPMIVLTGSTTMLTMLDCLRQGALAFCTKPLADGTQLLQAVEIAKQLVVHRRRQLQHLVRLSRQHRSSKGDASA
ncbi:MAG: response regulator [Planctomycetota bacterium]|nr:MAG: response regulator [Planctomycetota bacterium]